MRSADGEPRRIADQRVSERFAGTRAADPHLAHVRQVEQPNPLAHGAMLVEDAGRVLDGHLPAGEVDQPRAKRAMPLDEGGTKMSASAPLSALGRHASTPATDNAVSTTWRSVGIAEQSAGLVDRHPAHLIELVVVLLQAAASRLHQEEMNRLVDARPALGEEVLDGPDRRVDLDLEPSLLGDLTEGRLLDALGLIRRSLGSVQLDAVPLAASPAETDLEPRVRFADNDAAA